MPEEVPKRRVVVTGYGTITPLGKNSDDTFEKAAGGVSGVDCITLFDTRGLPCRIGGQVENAWIEEGSERLPRGFEKLSSRGLRLMIAAATEAARAADLDSITDRSRMGVSLGYHGENPSVEDMVLFQKYYDGAGTWDINGLARNGVYSYFNLFRRKPDVATSLLSILLNCRGSNLTVASACAAGSQAVGEAFRSIRMGRSDVMVAGGCESNLNFSGFIGFVLIRALSEKYASPQKASRPFDRKRNGFIMSEGAACVVLEEMEHARSRNASIFGELIGYGSSADAYRITDIHPQGAGAVYSMRGALDDAGVEPSDIDYINAHGTSTAQNDLVETIAIKKVFGERAKEIPVSSNKSMIGHTIAAAGAIECVLTLMGFNRSIVLPTINYEYPDPKCDLDYVPNEARRMVHRTALSNSFGFGGQNATLCLRKFEE